MTTQLTDYFAGLQAPDTTQEALAGLGGIRPPHISRRGNRFALVDGAGNSRPIALMDPQGNIYIDVIIARTSKVSSRLFYLEWDDENPGPPVCWSDNGTGPSAQAAQPQALTCAVCPQAGWGSAVSKLTGQGVPACQSSKKLAVLVVGDPDEIVYEFIVPPASWNDKASGWKKYVASIGSGMVGQRKAQLYDVVTRIMFLPGKNGILGFYPQRMITPDEAEMLKFSWEGDETMKAIGAYDVARDPNVPLPAGAVVYQLGAPAPSGMAPGANPAPSVPGNPGVALVPQSRPPGVQPRVVGEARTQVAQPPHQAAPAPGGDPGPMPPEFIRPQPGQAPAQPAQAPQQPAPAQTPETPAKRTRTRRAANVPSGAPEAQFLGGAGQGQPAPQHQAPPAPAQAATPGPTPQSLGMQTPMAPDAAMSEDLQSVFGLPTG